MKKRTINITRQHDTNWVAIVLALAVTAISIVSILTPREKTEITIENLTIDSGVPEGVEIDSDSTETRVAPVEVVQSETGPSGAATRIAGRYQAVGSPIADKIVWVVSEAEVRGLNPYLVLAVMAQESGWGRYCPRGNCFGWGFTDSGDMGIGDGSFENTTLHILDQLATYYGVQTAEEMHQLGYNFHDSWVVNVSLIESSF
jgi:hypothetical protein